jgi:hypothetical protein
VDSILISELVYNFPINDKPEAFLEALAKKLTTEAYSDLFDLLLGGKTQEFFENCWEKSPAIFRRGLSATADIPELFSKRILTEIVGAIPLEYESNFNILRYDGIDRDLWHCGDSLHPNSSDIKEIFREGYTVQFFQPQRFSDGLFLINASFEKHFQSLAGASAYLTPKLAQGLAPHWDDVEVFVLQTEGSKTWHLWPAPTLLAETHSKSIPREKLPESVIL